MVNIMDYWPKDSDVPEYSRDAWHDLLNRRSKVSEGFYALEREQGHFPDRVNLAMPDTQDYVRLLGFRFMEEILESFDSVSKEHRLEELIDAFNYLLNIGLIDKNYIAQFELVNVLYHKKQFFNRHLLSRGPKRYNYFYEIVKAINGDLSETLRNRSWMEQAQDIQWAGKPVFLKSFGNVVEFILSEFPDWSSFWKFFVAKDEVLKFRLESKY